MTACPKSPSTLLLVESDVIIRFALADFLRHCGLVVIEAVNGRDAKAVLTVGPPIDVMMSDAQLADHDGFALAQWVRRHRAHVEVILTSSVANKAEAAAEFCSRDPERKPPSNGDRLAARVHAMLSERRRRMRPQSTTASAVLPRRKRQ